MHQHMAELIKRLSAAGARRTTASAWPQAKDFETFLGELGEPT